MFASLDLCLSLHMYLFQIVILEHKSIICAGYSAVLHIHTCAEEATIKKLICLIDKKTGEKTPTRFIKQDQIGIARLQVNAGMICMETFQDFPQMGRFTLRDEGNIFNLSHLFNPLLLKPLRDKTNKITWASAQWYQV